MALLQSLGKLIGGAAKDVARGYNNLIPQNTGGSLPPQNALGTLLYSGSHVPPTFNQPNIHPNFTFTNGPPLPGSETWGIMMPHGFVNLPGNYVNGPQGPVRPNTLPVITSWNSSIDAGHAPITPFTAPVITQPQYINHPSNIPRLTM